MQPQKKLMQRAIELMEKRGTKAVKKSRHLVSLDNTEYEPLNEAVQYFMNELWFDFLHPALVSLACEAVGGNEDNAIDVEAALVLLAGAADIHDDIIDESKTKGPDLTVYGKFGRDMAVLSGDVLLFRGLYTLNEGLNNVLLNKREAVLETVRKAFLELCGGEAKETSWRGKQEISKKDYLEILKRKSAASEAATRIGAIIGGGTEKEVETLSHYGRTLGMMMTMRNEFIDVFEPDELKNRLKKECLPLPVLIAFQDDSRKTKILHLLRRKLSEEKIEKILDLSMDFSETKLLVEEMKKLVEKEISIISNFCGNKEELQLMLSATLEDI